MGAYYQAISNFAHKKNLGQKKEKTTRKNVLYIWKIKKDLKPHGIHMIEKHQFRIYFDRGFTLENIFWKQVIFVQNPHEHAVWWCIRHKSRETKGMDIHDIFSSAIF